MADSDSSQGESQYEDAYPDSKQIKIMKSNENLCVHEKSLNHDLLSISPQLPWRYDEWLPANWSEALPHPFKGYPGIKYDTTFYDAVHYFQLFVPNSLFDQFVMATNQFVSQLLEQQNGNGEIIKQLKQLWVPTTMIEMKKFIGLLLLMGIIEKPNVFHYWSLDPLYETPLFQSIMTKKRFILLLRCLRFNDDQHRNDKDEILCDRLCNIRPLLDYFNQKFRYVYDAEQDIALHTLTIKVKRKHICEETASHETLVNIKLHYLRESKSGYMFQFQVCNDDSKTCTRKVFSIPTETEKWNFKEKLALSLLQPFLDQGYNVYMDQHFTSIPLFDYLYRRKTNACGIILPQNLPPTIENLLNQSQEEMIAYRSGPLLCLKWRKEEPLCILSSLHSDLTTQQVNHQDQPKQSNDMPNHDLNKKKITALLRYDQNMDNASKQDLSMKLQHVSGKAVKLGKKLGIQLLQVCMRNAFIIFQNDRSYLGKSFLQFQHDVITDLLFCEEKMEMEKKEATIRLTGRHFIQHLKPSKFACRVCCRKGTLKYVYTICSICPNDIGLCLDPCFRLFHTILRYWE